MVVSTQAPALAGPVLSAQRWRDLTFLHWPVDPAAVAGLLPTGVDPDLIDGATYVGLVPFRMRGAGPGRLPVPYLGDFAETNVRLYSVDPQGRHGVVFATLEASRLFTVLLARVALGLPYTWARMSVTRRGPAVRYTSVRRWPRPAGSRAATALEIEVGRPTEATPLETWLTSRWGLHTRIAGRTVWVPNEHGPWPLFEATLRTGREDLVGACGVEPVGPMLRPLFTPGVATRFGRPALVPR